MANDVERNYRAELDALDDEPEVGTSEVQTDRGGRQSEQRACPRAGREAPAARRAPETCRRDHCVPSRPGKVTGTTGRRGSFNSA
jgi:hypothetical protein